MQPSEKLTNFTDDLLPILNRTDLHALTLVGPPRDNPELDTLAVLHLNNRQYMKGDINLTLVTVSTFALFTHIFNMGLSSGFSGLHRSFTLILSKEFLMSV